MQSGNATSLANSTSSGFSVYTVTGANSDTTLRQDLSSAAVGSVNVTATCTAAPSTSSSSNTGNPTDSQNVHALQTALTKTAATISGDAISQQVNGAIGDGFSNSGTTVTPGPNGLTFNLAPEPQRSSRIQEAYDALAYAAMPTKAVPQTPRDWRIWGDIRGTGWTVSDPGGDQKGRSST